MIHSIISSLSWLTLAIVLSEAEEKARDFAFDAHTGELGAQKELDGLNTAAAKATVEIQGH